MNFSYKPSKWLILVLLGLTIPAVRATASNLNMEDSTSVAAEMLAMGSVNSNQTSDLRADNAESSLTIRSISFEPVLAMGPGAGPPVGPPPGMPPGMPPGPPPGGGMMLPLMEADLTDEQVEKLVQLKSSFMDKVGPRMAKIHALEHDQRDALCQAQINASDVARISSQISAEKQTLDGLFTEHAISTAQILTQQQRQKLKALLNRRELGPPGFHPPAHEHMPAHE
jgi:Spy/CpxP family protein refolding chaperone